MTYIDVDIGLHCKHLFIFAQKIFLLTLDDVQCRISLCSLYTGTTFAQHQQYWGCLLGVV